MRDMKKYSLILVAALLAFTACDDSLDLTPQSELTTDSFFHTEADLQLFTNTLYRDLLLRDPYREPFKEQSDQYVANIPNNLVRGGTNRFTPASDVGKCPGEAGNWDWQHLRLINTALGYIESNCTDEAVATEYTAICRFFRALFYFEKVRKFGDVPWADHELGSDDPILYAPRDSREVIMQHMIEDVDYAFDHLSDQRSNIYRLNKWAALALKARFCLFEGTFRKYHNLNISGNNAEYYLQQAADAAGKLMSQGGYKLYSTGHPELDYAVLFCAYDSDPSEVILAYNFYHSFDAVHEIFSVALTAAGKISLTRKFAVAYLMKDGSRFTDKPGWETMQFFEETQDRDPRLGQTVRIPGYQRIQGTVGNYSYTGEPLSVDLNFTTTGYQVAKFVMPVGNEANDKFNLGYNDMPVFRLGETYLIYAEALAELGKLTQADLDKSVNLLRRRVGMPDLNLAQANANPDPYLSSKEWGYTNVTGANKGVILEIRRERGVELAMEGFRYADLLRWKAGKCMEQNDWGIYFPGKGTYDLDRDGKMDVCIFGANDARPAASEARFVWKLGEDINLSGGESGYMLPHIGVTLSFDEARDYYYPIPINDLSLNPALVQNPGWDAVSK